MILFSIYLWYAVISVFDIQFVSSFQLTRTVSVNLDLLKDGAIKVYFVCPDVRQKSDRIEYYRIEKNQKILIAKDTVAYGTIIKVTSSNDLGQYECVVQSADQTNRTAQLKLMDGKLFQNPEKLIYKPMETKYVIARSGSVKLNCGSPTGTVTTWYRPHQFQIFQGNELIIDNVQQYDYGTYYCTEGVTNRISIEGKKFIVVPDKPKVPEKNIEDEVTYMDSLIPRTKDIRYRPAKVTWNADIVTWEQPPGTVLLNYGRDLYIQSYVENITQLPYYYRIQRNGDLNVNTVGRLLISKKPNEEVEMTVQGRVAFGGTIKIDCFPSPQIEKDAKVIWTLKGKKVHEGNTFVIDKFRKEAFGEYSCEIYRGGVGIVNKKIDLIPKKIESKIEMTPDPGDWYMFHKGNKKELHCEIVREDNKWKFKSRDIIWTFNGFKLDKSNFGATKRYGRLDTGSVSILVLRDMDLDNEGTYKCFQGTNVFAANLVMEKSDLLLELSPPKQIAAHNVNQVAEFHCRIDTPGVNNSFIQWSFIPENSQVETSIPPEAQVDRPIQTTATSFLTIDNVLKRHEGTYVCRVMDKKVFGQLIVRVKPELTVSPKVVTVKPGGTARFLCQLTGVDGKVIWSRRDKKSFILNKENRLGGSTQSLLEVKHATLADHGTVYECWFNKLMEYVTLLVEDECPLNERKCLNGTCIDERKFCDGKDDCGDNSDEDQNKCNECSPNAIHCDFLKGADPTKRCVIKHWKCDGVDDCGNNFDELNCLVKNKDRCIGSHYLCNNDTLIPRAYWCDGEADCASMEDEEGCAQPQMIDPRKTTQILTVSNSTLILTCTVSGRPLPTINWRYNWGHLPTGMVYNVSESITNCSIITSTLTIENINLDHSGVYTCEAIAQRRIMAPDYVVSVSKGYICKKPYFNNDAWDESLCYKCYCSGRTDDCTSAVGYETSDKAVESQVKSSDAAIVESDTFQYNEPAKIVNFVDESSRTYLINDEQYKTLVPNPTYYFGGSFNMRESWLMRYGYPLTYSLTLKGDSVDYIKGSLVVIVGENGKSVHYCAYDNRLPVYASSTNYTNNIRIILWERDRWFSDKTCKNQVTRSDFMDILKGVRIILFRVKYFAKQENFRMSKISMVEAIKSTNLYSWSATVEKCNCPKGFSGLSCEIGE